MSGEKIENENQKPLEPQEQEYLDQCVLDLLETKLELLKTVLALTKDAKLDDKEQAADIYIDLIDKRQDLIDDALTADEQLKTFSGHKLSGGSKTKADAAMVETDAIIKQIIEMDKQNLALSSTILDDIRKNIKTLSGQKNANNAYSNDYAYGTPHFDKRK